MSSPAVDEGSRGCPLFDLGVDLDPAGADVKTVGLVHAATGPWRRKRPNWRRSRRMRSTPSRHTSAPATGVSPGPRTEPCRTPSSPDTMLSGKRTRPARSGWATPGDRDRGPRHEAGARRQAEVGAQLQRVAI